MNLTFHQFKISFRHVRIWLIVLWIIFLLQPWLARLNLEPDLGEVLYAIALIAEALLIKMIVVRTIHANPLVSSTAWWLTRPLSRRQVFVSQVLILVGCLLVPLMAVQGIYWVCAGLPFSQWCAAQLELAWLVVTVIALVATLASLTANYNQFLAAAGSYVGAFVLWVVLLELLQAHRVQTWQPGRTLSAILVGSGIFLAATLAAWLCQGLAGWRRAGFALLAAGLLAFMPVQLFWPVDFFRAPQRTNAAAQLQLLSNDDAANPALTNQVLWSHFKVAGLPANQLAVVRNAGGSFEYGQGQVALFENHSTGPYFAGDYRFDIWRRNPDLQTFIKASLPPGTLWLTDWGTMSDEALPIRGTVPRNGTVGRLRGEMVLDIFAVEKLVELPLERGSAVLGPGHRLAAVRVDHSLGRLRLKLQETTSQQVLRVHTFAAGGSRFHSDCLFVLHNPATGEALTFDPINGGRTGTHGLNQERCIEFTWELPLGDSGGTTDEAYAQQWLAHSRLHVFRLNYQGLARRGFAEENHTFYQVRDLASARTRKAPALAAMPANPPTNGTPAEVRTYVDALLDGLPDRTWSDALVKETRQKLERLGPAVVPALVRRQALADSTELHVVRPVLQSQVRAEHLPALLECLHESPAIAWLLLDKKWTAESQAALKPWLKQRKIMLPGAAVMLAARGRNPALNADLAWHFVQANELHGQMLLELRQVPGFEAGPAIAQAWKRMRLGFFQSDDLALAAAAEGLPEALSHAAARLFEQTAGAPRDNFRGKLSALIDYEGAPGEFEAWLLRNSPKLIYDPARRKYLAGK